MYKQRQLSDLFMIKQKNKITLRNDIVLCKDLIESLQIFKVDKEDIRLVYFISFHRSRSSRANTIETESTSMLNPCCMTERKANID